jgi:hypothetical protein
MPEVQLLTGWFGNIDPYAMNGFETLIEGPVSRLEGETQNGDVHLDTGWFGEPR